MKVSFLLPQYPVAPSGGFRVVYEYANHLVKRGHNVSVVHPYRLHPLPPRNKTFVQLLKSVQRAVFSRFHPDVSWQYIDPRVRMVFVPEPRPSLIPDGDAIVATWWETANLVASYPESKGKKFYLIQHYEVWGGPKEAVDATWKLPLKKIVIAKWLYELGLSMGVPESDMIHIPNAIDHNVFRILTPLESRPPQVCMLYSPLDWKGGPDGIKALALAREKFPSLRAILFGVGPAPHGLPSWMRYYQNPPQEFLVSSIYNQSQIYLCPSWTEGWHLPPAEAMACGCALVSTDIGGVRDYATHEKTALLSPPRRPELLAQHIVRLLSNDEERIIFARLGNENIRNFTWERSASMLERFLQENIHKRQAL